MSSVTRRGHKSKAPEEIRRDFFARVEPQENGCWLWTGPSYARNPRTPHLKYGSFYRGGYQTAMAHRFAYEAVRGIIPPGLTLDHLCRNTLCVNPDHLEPVTQTENNLRGDGAMARNARKSVCKNGHLFDISGFNSRSGRPYRYCSICRRDVARAYRLKMRQSLEGRA